MINNSRFPIKFSKLSRKNVIKDRVWHGDILSRYNNTFQKRVDEKKNESLSFSATEWSKQMIDEPWFKA